MYSQKALFSIPPIKSRNDSVHRRMDMLSSEIVPVRPDQMLAETTMGRK